MEAWTWITQNWTQIVAAVGGIVLASRIIVKLTPTPADDTFLEEDETEDDDVSGLIDGDIETDEES